MLKDFSSLLDANKDREVTEFPQYFQSDRARNIHVKIGTWRDEDVIVSFENGFFITVKNAKAQLAKLKETTKDCFWKSPAVQTRDHLQIILDTYYQMKEQKLETNFRPRSPL